MFSIIVANYNNGRFLPDLVKSVQAQTYPDWELVIVDDCSTDNSREIVSSFPPDKRIKVIYHTHNNGAAAAFRTAVENSAGEVVGMLGADDALVPDAVEKMLKAHEQNPGASLICSDCFACDADLSIVEKYRHYRALGPGEELIRTTTIGSFATFKRAAYDKTEGFDPFFKKALDHDIYLKLDEVGSLAYVHEPLYLYRLHEGGISQFDNGLRAAQYSILAKKNAYRRRRGTSKTNLSKSEYTELMIKWYVRESFFHRNKNKKECNRLLVEGLRNFPFIVLTKSYWSIAIRNNLNWQ
jgi:glycosyltransferase involved in cell wall biosynthesis